MFVFQSRRRYHFVDREECDILENWNGRLGVEKDVTECPGKFVGIFDGAGLGGLRRMKESPGSWIEKQPSPILPLVRRIPVS